MRGLETYSLMGSALQAPPRFQIPSQGVRGHGCVIPKGLPPPALTLTCLSGAQMTALTFTEHPSPISQSSILSVFIFRSPSKGQALFWSLGGMDMNPDSPLPSITQRGYLGI